MTVERSRSDSLARGGALLPVAIAAAAAAGLGVGYFAMKMLGGRGRTGNPHVPEPAKIVDLDAYLGHWYEFARYDNRFERGRDYVTATYTLRDDGLIGVINAGREGGANGTLRIARGKARVVPAADGAKLKVSFFGPFYVGDYWVLDHADDYTWSIVGEPTGAYLWILTREAKPPVELQRALLDRVRVMGYDLSMLRRTQQ